MSLPPAVRVLGLGGLAAAALMAVGGFYDVPMLVAASGCLMVLANIYAFVRGES